MPIPAGITHEDVLDAAARMDAGAGDGFGEPRGYLATVNGKSYPPKALIGLAARRVLGRDLAPEEFSSGVGPGQAVTVLRQLGVQVVAIKPSAAPAGPAAWIFQGNPDRFDIDGYLAAHNDITWLVKQHRDAIREGQTVYLWRASGRGKAVAGVVAVGSIAGEVEHQREGAAGLEYWHDAGDAMAADFRVPIHVVDVASAKRVIKANWLAEDPVCHDLPNLRNRQQTNYPLEPRHAERLARLWSKTGLDFDRLDLLLTLRAYVKSFGTAHSSLTAAVAKAALLSGRTVSSIDATITSFSLLDPRVNGAGQREAVAPTAEVWDEFWTGKEIDEHKLGRAIDAVLEPGSTPESLAALEAEAQDLAPEYSAEGRKRLVTHLKTERNRKVVADAKARWFVADPMLRCCHCSMSFVERYGPVGEGFIEAHHRKPLAELDGPQKPCVEDLDPVCANCHRMLHRGGGMDLGALIARIESRERP